MTRRPSRSERQAGMDAGASVPAQTDRFEQALFLVTAGVLALFGLLLLGKWIGGTL